MKITTKLALVLTLPLLLTWAVVLYAISLSEESLSKTLEQAAASRTISIMEEIERILHVRTEVWFAYPESPGVQKALALSNHQFEQMSDVQQYIDEIDTAWQAAPEESPTPEITRILENNSSKELRHLLSVMKNTNGFSLFGEVFITNRYGANIAQTGRTSDYRQDDEEWWQRAKQNGLYVDDVNFDESAGMYSLDLCVRIEDNNGEFCRCRQGGYGPQGNRGHHQNTQRR